MSRKVNINSLSDTRLQKISNDLIIKQEPSKYAFFQPPKYIKLFEIDNEILKVPFSYDVNLERPLRSEFPETKIDFVGELREQQKKVKSEAIESLNNHGSVIIACFPGFGKTCLSIYIACKLKMPTLIICNRIVLIKQWEESIKKFAPTARIQVLDSTIKLKDADFYIINASNVPKHTNSFYKDIGVLIVDECHLIMAEKLSECMRSIFPRYLIGLSATPYRHDGLNELIDFYFGKKKIEIQLFRKHTVYKVNTGFVPETKMNKMGKLDWGSVLDSQCNNPERNELIISLIKKFSDRVFLVLCKRVEQANYLFSRLKEENEDVTSLIGKNQTYEQKSRILIGTVQKAGTGFDHPRLNAMILASDVEQYFVQFLGRVFRREDTEPIIFDLVDNFGLLQKHYKSRQFVYIQHGGLIKNYSEMEK